MQTELAIIVYSCERNSKMWNVVMYFFKKYWYDCPCPIVLLTDTDREGQGLKAGFDLVVEKDSTWAEMMEAALDQTGATHFMTWMDDFLLCDKVDNQKFEECFRKAKELKAAFYKLCPANYTQLIPYDESTAKIKKGSAYSVSTHAGIWETESFRAFLRKEWSAWDFERIGSLESEKISREMYASLDYRIPYIEGIRKGKWFPEGVRLLKENGIRVQDTGKEEMAWKDRFIVQAKAVILSMNPNLVLRVQNRVNERKAGK